MNFPYIPPVISVRPVIVLTGFLGAGKTTLLHELLVNVKKHGLLSDVILNDYADASMDSARLEQVSHSIEPLTATCACCEGLDFLLDLSVKSSDSESDVLFIELNGTADPVPIVEAFTLLENKLKLHPRWQVCVIDVRSFGDRGAYRDIEELQLQTASHVYLSHEAGVKGYDREKMIARVKEINPYATIVVLSDLVEQIVSLGKAKKKRLASETEEEMAQKQSAIHIVKKSDQHALTHEFTACQILMPKYVKERVIRDWLDALPTDVIRVKLLIGIYEKPDHRYLFERVGKKVSKYPQKVNLGNKVPNSAILIGPDLKVEELQELAKQYI